MAEKEGQSQNQNLMAALSYLLGFITGIIFLLLEKENKFIRFHAMQSTITFGGLFVINIILNLIPVLGWAVNLILFPISPILWIILMVKAFQGDYFKLPYVGEIAEKQVGGKG